MSVREMQRWFAYFECIEPIPDPARDAAMICWVLALANHGKGPKPRLEDFMPQPPGRERPGQTQAEMMAVYRRHTGE